MASLTLTDIQHCPLALEVDDGAGNAVPAPAGAVSWGTSDSTIVTVTPSPDGASCDVAATGKLGSAQVTVSAQLDPSQPAITGTLDVTVTASAATQLVIRPGVPVAK